MRVAFRVDASEQIGVGHVFRCLVLADAVRRAGGSALFICRANGGYLGDLVAERGHAINYIDQSASAGGICDDAQATAKFLDAWTADWLVVDHYAIDATWEQLMARHVGHLMVIDDLANRPHRCDVLLDPSDFAGRSERYAKWVPASCELLVGPRYALLREEFFDRRLKRDRDGRIRRVLIFFGGTDPTGETVKTLEAMARLDLDLELDVVVGSMCPSREKIQAACRRLDVAPTIQATDIARRMSNADLAIGACGVASLERCALGLPAVAITVAENQKETGEHLARLGVVHLAGWHENVTPELIATAITGLDRHPECLRRMSAACTNLVGDGVREVFNHLLKHHRDAPFT